jgi:amino acid transporter
MAALDDVAQPTLRRELGRRDALGLLVAGIAGIDIVGAIASGGAESLSWLVVVAALFFVPAGLVVAELGSAFPAEGGAYVWTRLAFGRLGGSLTAFTTWVDAPVWLGGSLAITGVTVVDRLLLPLDGAAQAAFALAFVWAVVGAAVLPVRYGKWIASSGALAQVLLLSFFTATVVAYAVRNGVHGFAAGELAPGWVGLVGVAPLLVYAFLGLELASAAAGEMRDARRDVPAAIARAGVLTLVLYAVPVVSVLAVLPPERVTSLGGLVDAIATVFTVYGGAGSVLGAIVAVAFVWCLLANGLAWIMGSSRAQAVASLDGAGPRVLGSFSARTGTPVAALLGSGLIASATSGTAFAIAGGDADRYFSVVLTLSLVLLVLATAPIFPALLRLRRLHPHAPRPFRVPGGRAGAALASGLTTAWCLLAVAAALFPGLGTADPDAALPAGFEGERLAFTLSVAGPLAAFALVGLALSAWRAERLRPAPC